MTITWALFVAAEAKHCSRQWLTSQQNVFSNFQYEISPQRKYEAHSPNFTAAEPVFTAGVTDVAHNTIEQQAQQYDEQPYAHT